MTVANGSAESLLAAMTSRVKGAIVKSAGHFRQTGADIWQERSRSGTYEEERAGLVEKKIGAGDVPLRSPARVVAVKGSFASGNDPFVAMNPPAWATVCRAGGKVERESGLSSTNL